VAEKAKAMKELDGVGKEHEEFKLKLEKEKEIELAAIQIQQFIAEAQANVLGEAFKKANIDLVGGDTTFVNNIMNAIGRGKQVERMIDNSHTLQDMRGALLGNGTQPGLFAKIRHMVQAGNISAEDLKNLSLTALLLKLQSKASKEDRSMIEQLMNSVNQLGIGDHTAGELI